MNLEANDRKVSPFSPIQSQIIRKSLIIYLLSAIAVPVICTVLGWPSLENIGTGLIYGSLGLSIFGFLILAGNTVPAQLARLSIPKYNVPSFSRQQKLKGDGPEARDRGIRFFLATLISGAFLFATGLFLKMLW